MRLKLWQNSWWAGVLIKKEKKKEYRLVLKREPSARTKPWHRLVAFGEMVALLWAEGKRDATIRLEEFWNELAEKYTFDLLCGYPIAVFHAVENGDGISAQ